ncbi:hypothetical protein WJ97_13825 [Burkholderia ubonensis]|uniref:hypothetical protein n=1 Tax=Burkholderia ubonensis TaxID=101571 RepID=UPI00075A7BF2|nr:hypothetical protein [Burkholderia ubonensis]KVP96899.1 hypothetical protein WJ97_13825 [Burkholderia ubonensis]
MTTIIEFGVNEVMPTGVGVNPFDENFDTEDEAVEAGIECMKDDPSLQAVRIFMLTIRNDVIVGDESLRTITRDEL